MPSVKKKDIENNTNNDIEFDPVKFLKSLTIDHFLACKETRNILINEHYWKFESKLKPILIDLYCRYNSYCIDFTSMFGKDPHIFYRECFADIIYDKYIEKDYDLSIFYNNPELAMPLFELNNK